MKQYQNAWQAVWRRIDESAAQCGRNVNEIALLAVSKQFPPEAVRRLYALGQRRFGENYVQEARDKQQALADLDGLWWALTGPLQRNKATLAARIFDRIETVDTLALAERLSAARPDDRPPLEVLIQVNISGEPQKSGVMPEAAVTLAGQIAPLPRLRWCGFMGIAAATDEVPEQRRQFALLRRCQTQARAAGLPADVLSMGMSGDLDAAIAEGSTEVRIGSALFGPRPG
ncbi:MAG: YggS family pyridoxal phosphate-dependent enzyme [Proteobacteria bacterium]|nr:YggS family pyridoxal phosphate-dependent enzyme [Pseudomonadota bacterium]MCL2306641.1 YggS family pyridoxal phosphate-dependent enzyme [Pseudomonadota bacterium]